MRILMLGWEFPPFIAGGLGVACYGLTRALDKLGHEVIFVLPRAVDGSEGTHVRMVAPEPARERRAEGDVGKRSASGIGDRAEEGPGFGSRPGEVMEAPGGFRHATFRTVPATFSNPYAVDRPVGEAAEGDAPGADGARDGGGGEKERGGISGAGDGRGAEKAGIEAGGGMGAVVEPYGRDLIGDAERYARMVVSVAGGISFDVIHAHDWLTFPAGLALSRVTGKPLIVHVHATEFDRAGEHVNPQVYEIERRGLHGASRAIAVSMLTKSVCAYRYGVAGQRVDVIYNGISEEEAQPAGGDRIESDDKIVLFLGRLTMQKGPEYFIGAARRVLEKVPNVKFVVAGSGDMAVRMIEMAAELGIGHRVLFTGFLRRSDVLRVYRMADCYVMPSVSEPFGLVALEAIQNDVPAIISKQSGAAEVLRHVLKVDFWDVDEIANKIVAVLQHPPLGATLREHGPMELRRLTWDGAAAQVIKTYQAAGVRANGRATGQPGSPDAATAE